MVHELPDTYFNCLVRTLDHNANGEMTNSTEDSQRFYIRFIKDFLSNSHPSHALCKRLFCNLPINRESEQGMDGDLQKEKTKMNYTNKH
jgi:hypothetical protein